MQSLRDTVAMRKVNDSIMEKIDNLDRKILEIIMKNARIPSKDVAVVCGVSRAAIHQRIQRLSDMGVIVGSGYQVNPKMLGYATCTYVGVKLERGSMYRDHLMELLNDKIQMIHGVVATETLISLDQSINREIPIRYEE